MSENKFGEPWRFEPSWVDGADRYDSAISCGLADDGVEDYVITGDPDSPIQAERTLSRIVACVNACAGIEDPAQLRSLLAESVGLLRIYARGYCVEDGGAFGGGGGNCGKCINCRTREFIARPAIVEIGKKGGDDAQEEK